MPLQLQSSELNEQALERKGSYIDKGTTNRQRERERGGDREKGRMTENKFWCVAFFKFACKHAINMYASASPAESCV